MMEPLILDRNLSSKVFSGNLSLGSLKLIINKYTIQVFKSILLVITKLRKKTSENHPPADGATKKVFTNPKKLCFSQYARRRINSVLLLSTVSASAKCHRQSHLNLILTNSTASQSEYGNIVETPTHFIYTIFIINNM